MQTKAFVEFLTSNRMPVFTLNDAIKITRYSRGYAKLFLHRCAQKGLLGRVERGLYYLKERSNEYEIASHILHPSYVSMISALAYYGLTTQIPRVVYVVSQKRHRTIEDIGGFDIVFRRMRNEMMFGYHKEADGNIFIADPEKAIVDICYFNDVNDLDEAALENPPRVDISRLVLYARMSKSRSVMRRVSALLRSRGYAARAKELAGIAAGAQG